MTSPSEVRDTLPDKPSELILVALMDLEKCEADPRYDINMGVWHEPNSHCSVCFAGAVIAKTLQLPADKPFDPWGFDESIKNKLRALDLFRAGWIYDALYAMGFFDQARDPDFRWEAERYKSTSEMPFLYRTDPKAFKDRLHEIAEFLNGYDL